MKKLFKAGYPYDKCTAGEYTERRLNGSDYDRGQLETHSAELDSIKQMLGRLVQHLFDKKLITHDEVYLIVDNYIPRDK